MNASMNLNPYAEYNTYISHVYPARTGNLSGDDGKYIVTTKILVLALAVLFAVVFFVVCLHIYAKWIWSTSPAQGSISFSVWPRRRRNRASPGDEIVPNADALDITTVMGLGKSAVEALPTFKYTMADHLKSSKTNDHLECAICLGKFEESDIGRALPKCNHSFHLDCIDMWLYSHSTCPLCRAVLDPSSSSSSSSSSPRFETPTIPFETLTIRASPVSTPSRLHNTDPDQFALPQPTRTPPQSEQASPRAEDPATKRADTIPANVLFWGTNNTAQQESRLSPVLNNSNTSSNSNSNSPRAAALVSQVVIDIAPDVLNPDRHQ